MARRDILEDLRPTVVVRRPSKSDIGLMNAWRFCSDDLVASELETEIGRIKQMQEGIRLFNLDKNRSRVFYSVIKGSFSRINTIRRLQRVRKDKNSGVQDNSYELDWESKS